jgi:hypothetical protein
MMMDDTTNGSNSTTSSKRQRLSNHPADTLAPAAPCSTAVNEVLGCIDLVVLVCCCLPLADVHVWRQSCRAARAAAKRFVSATTAGLRSQFEAHLRLACPGEAAPVQRFIAESGGMVVGSTVLQHLSGSGDDWKANDLDIVAPLTEAAVSAFERFLAALPPSGFPIGVHDSINDKLTVTERNETNTPYRRLTASMQGYEYSTFDHMYQKHLKTFYIHHETPARGQAIEVIFIDGVNSTAQLWQWMCEWFDVTVCINGVSSQRVLCHCPDDIHERRATLRLDQYCHDAFLTTMPAGTEDEELPLTYRESVSYVATKCGAPSESDGRTQVLCVSEAPMAAFRLPTRQVQCCCSSIIPARVKKYIKRGYVMAIQSAANIADRARCQSFA